MKMGCGITDWSSKKQPLIAKSSVESEYISLGNGGKELQWGRNFIGEFSLPFPKPTAMLCDNQGAIALAKTNTFHSRSKHIDIRYHYIRDIVKKKEAVLEWIPSKENLADIFTKAIARPQFEKLRTMLGLREA